MFLLMWNFMHYKKKRLRYVASIAVFFVLMTLKWTPSTFCTVIPKLSPHFNESFTRDSKISNHINSKHPEAKQNDRDASFIPSVFLMGKENLDNKNTQLHDDPHSVSWKSFKGITYVLISIGLVMFSGLTSGLTLGFMSVDPRFLRVLSFSLPEKQRARVKAVEQVSRHRHLLLVTLLLSNTIAVEGLPMFLDRLVPSWVALVISVTAVLVFGEILPQAVCSGRKQLWIMMFSAPYVRFLILLFCIISWPIAKALDLVLGVDRHQLKYTREQLRQLIHMHEREEGDNTGDGLDPQEVVLIEEVLRLSSICVRDVYSPLSSCSTLSETVRFDKEALLSLLSQDLWHVNQSRLRKEETMWAQKLSKTPHEGDLSHDTEQKPTLQNQIHFVCPEQTLLELITLFKKKDTTIYIVVNDFEDCLKTVLWNKEGLDANKVLGIVTLRDAIRQLFFLSRENVLSIKSDWTDVDNMAWSSTALLGSSCISSHVDGHFDNNIPLSSKHIALLPLNWMHWLFNVVTRSTGGSLLLFSREHKQDSNRNTSTQQPVDPLVSCLTTPLMRASLMCYDSQTKDHLAPSRNEASPTCSLPGGPLDAYGFQQLGSITD